MGKTPLKRRHAVTTMLLRLQPSLQQLSSSSYPIGPLLPCSNGHFFKVLYLPCCSLTVCSIKSNCSILTAPVNSITSISSLFPGIFSTGPICSTSSEIRTRLGLLAHESLGDILTIFKA